MRMVCVVSRIGLVGLLLSGSQLGAAQATNLVPPSASQKAAAAAETPPMPAVAAPAAPVTASAEATQATAPAAPLDPKAAKAAAAAERKRLAELKKLYGEGPYPDEIEAYVANKPEPLKPFYRTLYTGGARNAVLNYQRLGMAAIDKGHWSDAERAFDGALMGIEAIYANNKQASAARDTFRKEANKDYKGEPYERAMAYYYRGLLYLRTGDYDNARASFRSAEYQDTISEQEEFQSDFAIMNYLTGWTYHCQGSTSSAQEAFAQATAAQPGLKAPAAGEKVLYISELGMGPTKVRGGAQSQLLQFEPNSASADLDAKYAFAPNNEVPAQLASSISYQATTRGGRAIDGIMNGKANFKQTTGAIGNAFTQVGFSQMAQGNNNGGALASMGMGMMFSLFSGAAKTQADIRAWDGLPEKIFVAPATKTNTYASTNVWSAGAQTTTLTPKMTATAGNCTMVWARQMDASILPPETPGDDAKLVKSLNAKKDVQARNKAFRTQLAGS